MLLLFTSKLLCPSESKDHVTYWFLFCLCVCLCLTLTSHQHLRSYGDGARAQSNILQTWEAWDWTHNPLFTSGEDYPLHHCSSFECVCVSNKLNFSWWHFKIYEQDKFHAQFSWARKKFYNLCGADCHSVNLAKSCIVNLQFLYSIYKVRFV